MISSRLRAVLPIVALLLAAGLPAGVSAAPRGVDDPLALGLPGLPEYRTRTTVTAGVTLTIVQRGPTALLAGGAPTTGGGDLDEPGVGPWAVHILEIDPARFHGTLRPELASEVVVGKETVSSIAARTGAVAAVNGGFFIVGTQGAAPAANGVTGDVVGASVIDGHLVSEAVNGRSAVVTRPGMDVSLVRARTDLRLVAADGEALMVDGLNRLPGLISMCGGVGGDQPTEAPRAPTTCTDADEVVVFDGLYGAVAPEGEGFQVVLDQSSRVVTEGTRAAVTVPPGGQVVVGTGSQAAALDALADVGERLTIDVTAEADGVRLELTPQLGVVSGGPQLVRDSAIAITALEEGFAPPDDPAFEARWTTGPNPRTMIGTTADGHVLLVVVDGRQQEWSAGISIPQAARLMLGLGAVDAINLDGGGSSTMVVGDAVVNRPSDLAERPVGDALVLLPPNQQ